MQLQHTFFKCIIFAELREICDLVLPRSNESEYESHFIGYGYNFSEFHEILHYVSRHSIQDRVHLELLYQTLDKNNKGWVDREDFAKVYVILKIIHLEILINLSSSTCVQKSVAKVAPNFSKAHSARRFDLLDTNGTKVVYYIAML